MAKPSQNEQWVECGVIGRPVGVKGQVSVFWNNGTCPLGEKGGEIFLDVDGDYKNYQLVSSKPQGKRHAVTLHGLLTRSAAAALTGRRIFLRTFELPLLAEGEYYSFQILGLHVVTEEGKQIGTITKIFSAGRNDVYEVLPEDGRKGSEVLIPAIDQFIVRIDLEKKEVVIREIQGLLE